MVKSEIEFIKSCTEETLQENEQTVFDNLAILSSAISLLFLLLQKYPDPRCRINIKIKTFLSKWRSQFKARAKTSASISLSSASRLSTRNNNTTKSSSVGAFKSPGYYKPRQTNVDIEASNEEAIEEMAALSGVRLARKDHTAANEESINLNETQPAKRGRPSRKTKDNRNTAANEESINLNETQPVKRGRGRPYRKPRENESIDKFSNLSDNIQIEATGNQPRDGLNEIFYDPTNGSLDPNNTLHFRNEENISERNRIASEENVSERNNIACENNGEDDILGSSEPRNTIRKSLRNKDKTKKNASRIQVDESVNIDNDNAEEMNSPIEE